MKTLRLSRRAASDLEAIFDYSLETFGLKRASDYRDGLRTVFSELLEGSRAGRAVDTVRRGLRRENYESHAVFFRRDDQGIFVVRVLHQRRDFKRHL